MKKRIWDRIEDKIYDVLAKIPFFDPNSERNRNEILNIVLASTPAMMDGHLEEVREYKRNHPDVKITEELAQKIMNKPELYKKIKSDEVTEEKPPILSDQDLREYRQQLIYEQDKNEKKEDPM